MADYRITLKGFTLKEANELEERIQSIDGVDSTAVRLKFLDAAAGPSGSPMASLSDMQMVVDAIKHSSELLAVTSMLRHMTQSATDRIGAAIGDAIVAYFKAKFAGKSVVEPEALLYGSDGKLITHQKGKR